MRRAFLAATLLIAASTVCLAAGADKFAEHKQKILDRIQVRQQALTELQGCVQAANNKADLKTCEQKHRAEVAALKTKS
jgi:hypothetical protein